MSEDLDCLWWSCVVAGGRFSRRAGTASDSLCLLCTIAQEDALTANRYSCITQEDVVGEKQSI